MQPKNRHHMSSPSCWVRGAYFNPSFIPYFNPSRHHPCSTSSFWKLLVSWRYSPCHEPRHHRGYRGPQVGEVKAPTFPGWSYPQHPRAGRSSYNAELFINGVSYGGSLEMAENKWVSGVLLTLLRTSKRPLWWVVFRGHFVPSLKLTASLPMEIWWLEDYPFLLGQRPTLQVRTVSFREGRWKKPFKKNMKKHMNKKNIKGLDLRWHFSFHFHGLIFGGSHVSWFSGDVLWCFRFAWKLRDGETKTRISLKLPLKSWSHFLKITSWCITFKVGASPSKLVHHPSKLAHDSSSPFIS